MREPTRGPTGAVRPAEPDADEVADTDPVLWQRAAGGDRAAFGELFERHVKAVWNHAYRLTGSWSLAEDLAATTFLTAWRRRADITLVRDSALPWLYAVAGNLARSEHRRLGRFLRAVRTMPPADTAHDHADDVASRIGDDQRLAAVLAAVRALPDAQRKVVELFLIGGLSTAEAAAVLGISEVGVRSGISRARRRLRMIVEEER